jgi:phosphopantothenoylcysteine decarboxylase
MPNVLLGVTGSVAAIRTPLLLAALRRAGMEVKIVATTAASYFFDLGELDPAFSPQRNPSLIILDEDEWPGRDKGQRYHRGDAVLHIELRRWADLFLIAPLDANTLAKLAHGLSDNCLTCVWRAWDPARPVVLAPAMNTMMWRHPLTAQHLRQLGSAAGAEEIPSRADEMRVVEAINERSPTLRIVPPQIKELACGDVGVGAMADVPTIVDVVAAQLSRFHQVG